MPSWPTTRRVCASLASAAAIYCSWCAAPPTESLAARFGVATVPSAAARSSASADAGVLAGKTAVVGQSPFGLSIEYPLIERALGSGACPSPALVRTLRELGSPPIRIGGDSQDLAGPTAAYHYDVPASFWPTLGCLARETGAQIVVGLNFAEGPVADELTTIAAAEGSIPASQLSFSLGNEPDVYAVSHPLPTEPGLVVPAYRPPSWNASEFVGEWDARRAMLGQIRLEGPDFAGSNWGASAAGQLAANPPDTFDVHAYPTSACGVGTARTTTTRLLSRHAGTEVLDKYDWLLALARRTHRPVIVSETNSASCGGKPGISDTPVASVWAVRYVLAALLEGFAQVRFHSAGGSYDPLVFGADGSVTMRPLGRALLFLHDLLAAGARLVSRSHDPDLLVVEVASGARRSTIVSSFASKPVPYTLSVPSARSTVRTDTLTTTSALEQAGSARVSDHRARLLLEPDTVVAVETR